MKMRTVISPLIALTMCFAAFSGCDRAAAPVVNEEDDWGAEIPEAELAKHRHRDLGQIVIANRASGTISVIDANTDAVSGTYDLPEGDNTNEPMYVVWSAAKDLVYVGDRGNDRVVAFNPGDFSVAGEVAVGAGVFHMWADFKGKKQLWVNNDVDKTTSVIDLETMTVVATVPTPADLVDMGGKPHDVIVEARGRAAYVSVIGVAGDNDYIVQFDTETFEEIGRAAVGNDPHLSLSPENRKLFVPCQGADKVFVLDLKTLAQITTIDVPNAHGAIMSLDGKALYTTNISDGGSDGIFGVHAAKHIVKVTADTPFPVPHNAALTPQDRVGSRPKKLYITHSGATADKVSVYDVSRRAPVHITDITVGLNPFGLAFAR